MDVHPIPRNGLVLWSANTTRRPSSLALTHYLGEKDLSFVLGEVHGRVHPSAPGRASILWLVC